MYIRYRNWCHRYHIVISVSSASGFGIIDIRYRYRYHRYQVLVSSISGIGIVIIDIGFRYRYHHILPYDILSYLMSHVIKCFLPHCISHYSIDFLSHAISSYTILPYAYRIAPLLGFFAGIFFSRPPRALAFLWLCLSFVDALL